VYFFRKYVHSCAGEYLADRKTGCFITAVWNCSCHRSMFLGSRLDARITANVPADMLRLYTMPNRWVAACVPAVPGQNNGRCQWEPNTTAHGASAILVHYANHCAAREALPLLQLLCPTLVHIIKRQLADNRILAR
jgi:hypothetical protein